MDHVSDKRLRISSYVFDGQGARGGGRGLPGRYLHHYTTDIGWLTVSFVSDVIKKKVCRHVAVTRWASQ